MSERTGVHRACNQIGFTAPTALGGNANAMDASDDDTLLATVLGSGGLRCAEHGGLRKVLELTNADLAMHGISAQAAKRMRAATELGRRYTAAQIQRGQALSGAAEIREALRAHLRDLDHEIFACLFLDAQRRIIHYEIMFRGTVDSCNVHPREIIKRALEVNAVAIIAARNHPSRSPRASRADRAMAMRIRAALALLDMKLIDHFVISDGETTSFNERGWL